MTTAYVETKARITCPKCQAERTVSARQRRRIEQGIHDSLCWWCRRGTNRLRPERYMRFWLEQAGEQPPKGADMIAWIDDHGVPDSLVKLAADIWPEFAPPDTV